MTLRPRIAVVGRPNVGKSTLFNRLTGRRTALVSDMPGLTRDRREGEADIHGIACDLIDTAGLEEAPPDTIPGRMRAQSETAIRQADLVLFVIDMRAGVTPSDAAFARIVRSSGRPCVLVANKCEGRKGAEAIYEAFELGLGEPVAISAEHGEGLSDLEDAVLEALKAGGHVPENHGQADEFEAEVEDDTAPDRAIRMAIVGRPNAGKSTLVNALLGEERMITGPEPGLTRDSIATPFTWKTRDGDRELELFDTAGLRRKSRIEETAERLSAGDSLRAIRFAEIVVLVVDAQTPLEHQDLTIAEHVIEEGRVLIVAVNKWDLVAEKQSRLKEIRRIAGDKLAQVPNLPVIPVSALAEKGLDKLMAAAFEAYAIWNKRVSTPDLNRWLAEAVARHSPPQNAGRRVKIRYITQPGIRPPSFIAFTSQPQALPKSYERYLTNSLRETFGFPSVPIRLTLRKGRNPYADR